MQLITVAETDLELSKVCLGTMTFGSQVTEAAAARMVDFALERGVNFIDTANVYNGGLSEEITGRILARAARRSCSLRRSEGTWERERMHTEG